MLQPTCLGDLVIPQRRRIRFRVPPYLTFAVSDYQYVVTFAGMLAVALVISARPRACAKT
jgi:hypothetical protein